MLRVSRRSVQFFRHVELLRGRRSKLQATGLGLVTAAGIAIIAISATAGPIIATQAPGAPSTRPVEAAPTPETLNLDAIVPQNAQILNDALAVSDLPNPAAEPFYLAAGSIGDRERAVICLTSAIYYEAANEQLDGQRAVAQVVLNRLRHPSYPNSVCGVVYQGMERKTGCQFTFTCDGSLARLPVTSFWNRARRIAEAALAGDVYEPVGWATHYHTNWVVPYWRSSLVKVAVVGGHIFYRWTGSWGNGPAFRTLYAGSEPRVNMLPETAVEAPPVMNPQDAPNGAIRSDAADAVLAPGSLAPTAIGRFYRAAATRYPAAPRKPVASVSPVKAKTIVRPPRLPWTLSGFAAAKSLGSSGSAATETHSVGTDPRYAPGKLSDPSLRHSEQRAADERAGPQIVGT